MILCHMENIPGGIVVIKIKILHFIHINIIVSGTNLIKEFDSMK